MSPARILRETRQQSDRGGRTPFVSGRWSMILAVLGTVTLISNSLLAQTAPPFVEQQPRGNSQARSGRNGPAVRPNRPAKQQASRFSDARPITPSGQHPGSGEADKNGRSSVGQSAWKTFGTLAAIIGLIVVGARFWKKHGPKLTGGLPVEAIDVLGKRSVDARQSIVLVRLGSRILVLGSTANGLRTLSEVTDPVEVDYLAGLCHQRDAESGVAQSFRSLFGGQMAAGSTVDSAEASAAIPFARPEVDEHDAVPRQQSVSGAAHV
ncbi:MAG: FliO/MopB family protein [Planctomycetaceae bacterium]|jgi:flagellar biogenesis protein FliO|nr:FliO/MopB family protein [Planctomycetaceae bacterium]MBT6157393.1 FliO/MopB family protein [Planctomycetaceae bacterium]MBT6483443.1 FliO/MopB family protein [Planctomycetaceae bacterium]MBT6493893.1 FliO/MopB family protein [Planctomycetaceae bacterium]